MISDAVIIFANALVEKETYKLDFQTKPFKCDQFEEDQELNSNGQVILDNINNVTDMRRFLNLKKCQKSVFVLKFFRSPNQIEVNGSTGPIHFDQAGQRNAFHIEVVNPESWLNGAFKVAAKYQCLSKLNSSNCDPKNWKNSDIDDMEYFEEKNSTQSEEVVATKLKGQKDVVVIMRLGEPYLILK